ncbi:MAG: prepilin-type N-terminal cleavage/methylation domain-containing protein [Myxococcota bacterium]
MTSLGPGRSDRAGFTLTELVVALAVLSIIISQFLLAFSNQQSNYHEHETVVDAQQDARAVMELILDDLRMAGFMVPKQAGAWSLDGGPNGSDVLCASDPAVIAESRFSASNGRFDGARLTAALGGAATSVSLDPATLDVDADGNDDFSAGQGILVTDGDESHCAVITAVGGGTVSFDVSTPGGFAVAPPQARAVPANVYRVAGNRLTRNGQVLSTQVEDLQVEFGVDEDADGDVEAAEFPIHDLSGSSLDQIRTARVYVTVQTPRPDPDFAGGYTAAANRAAGPADTFRRRRLIGDATLRNMR